MDNILLFITGVLSGIIVGFLISRSYSKKYKRNDGSKESFLEENLYRAERNLEENLLEINNQRKEIKDLQQCTQDLIEKAAIKETELKIVLDEKNKLDNNQSVLKKDFEYLRDQKELYGIEIGELKEQNKSLTEESARIESEKVKLEKLNQITINQKESLRNEREKLNNELVKIRQKLESQETQAKFLEQAKSSLVIQFRALSSKMLEGSRDDLLKRTKETVTDPFTKQVENLRKQVELLSKDSTEKLSALRQTTLNLDKKSDDVKGAALQLTSALRSPNVKGRWGEVNLKES